MKVINKYVNEITGREYRDKKECEASETRSLSVRQIFKFWKEAEPHTRTTKDGNCDFANGEWCVQRTKAEYDELIQALILAIKLHEPGVAENYEREGGLKPEFVNSMFILGRYLGDGDSEINHWLHITGCTCQRCFREYGQPYHATHCGCSGKIETRVIQ
jgi:hypothetical protein